MCGSEGDWRGPLLFAFVDILHQLSEKVGLLYTGSLLYSILSTSSILWTSLLSAFYLKRSYHLQQYFGVLFVGLGLVVNSLHLNWSYSETQLKGFVLILFSSILHSISHVLNEKFISGKSKSYEPGIIFISRVGVINTLALLIWTLVWTVPRRKELFFDSIETSGGEWSSILLSFFALLASNFARSVVLMTIVKRMGVLSLCMMKGARLVTIVIASHLMFCSSKYTQCINEQKFSAVVLCLVGGLLFSSPIINFDHWAYIAKENVSNLFASGKARRV